MTPKIAEELQVRDGNDNRNVTFHNLQGYKHSGFEWLHLTYFCYITLTTMSVDLI